MDYSNEELSTPKRVVFDHHMERCPNCREYLALYLAAVRLGRHAFEDDDAPAVTSGVPEELVAAILAAQRLNRTDTPR
jgi:anti-sigma factor RsiW